MIEIFKGAVRMPSKERRRFQLDFDRTQCPPKYWGVFDKQKKGIVYKGNYEDAIMETYYGNKNYYRDLQKKNSVKKINQNKE